MHCSEAARPDSHIRFACAKRTGRGERRGTRARHKHINTIRMKNMIMAENTKARHFYGAVTVGERGQVVIPSGAREDMGIKPGDKLIVLGAHGKGVMMLKPDQLREMAEKILRNV